MTPIFIAIVLPAALFVLFAGAQTVIKKKYCALCAAVSGSWIILLGMYWTGMYQEKIAVAVLMGETATGIMYLAEKKLQEKFWIFKLPYLLSASFVVMLLLGVRSDGKTYILVGVLWVIFSAIYIYRENEKVKKIAQKLIACCRDW